MTAGGKRAWENANYTERPRREPTAALLWNLLQISPVEFGVVLNDLKMTLKHFFSNSRYLVPALPRFLFLFTTTQTLE